MFKKILFTFTFVLSFISLAQQPAGYIHANSQGSLRIEVREVDTPDMNGNRSPGDPRSPDGKWKAADSFAEFVAKSNEEIKAIYHQKIAGPDAHHWTKVQILGKKIGIFQVRSWSRPMKFRVYCVFSKE